MLYINRMPSFSATICCTKVWKQWEFWLLRMKKVKNDNFLILCKTYIKFQSFKKLCCWLFTCLPRSVFSTTKLASKIMRQDRFFKGDWSKIHKHLKVTQNSIQKTCFQSLKISKFPRNSGSNCIGKLEKREKNREDPKSKRNIVRNQRQASKWLIGHHPVTNM
jgi:hypothetical protein